MADVSKIDIDGTQWDIKDATARNEISSVNTELSSKITELQTTVEERLTPIENIFSTHGAIRVETYTASPTISAGTTYSYLVRNPASGTNESFIGALFDFSCSTSSELTYRGSKIETRVRYYKIFNSGTSAITVNITLKYLYIKTL